MAGDQVTGGTRLVAVSMLKPTPRADQVRGAKWAWTSEYFRYSYQNGWGYSYRNDYSLAVVLTYLAAFLVGLIVCAASLVVAIVTRVRAAAGRRRQRRRW